MIQTWPTRLVPGPGNFIFASGGGRAGCWMPVLIGECEDLSTLEDHVLRRAGPDRLTVSHIHFRPNQDAGLRRHEVADLVALWVPAGNASGTGHRWPT
jgi:hypothetical protein